MNQSLSTQVLIVGAGPTGLTLACDLARRGVACRLVDRTPAHFAGSRGKGLQPRTLEVLDDLGVLDAVMAAGAPYPPMRAHDGATVLGDHVMFERREPTPDVPYPNILLLGQWRAEEILRARLAEHGAGVELATELIGFEQDRDGVTATLARAGGTERLRAAYMIGADGGRSFVRRALGVGFEGETLEAHRALVGDVRADGLDCDRWHVWPKASGGPVALCPLPGTDRFQIMAPLPGEEAVELTVEAVQRLFEARTGRSDVRLRDASWLSLYRPNVRMVDRYRVGRVFLAGDAAHVHPAAGGQGLNTGIQDAYNLGWKLGQVLAGAPEALLDTYEEERLPVARAVLGLTAKLHHQAAEEKPGALRRGAETQQLDITYRGSSLARDERGGGGGAAARVLPGDRAPDAPCQDHEGAPVRLFDVFRGPHFTLLAFGAAHADTVARVNVQHRPAVRARAVVRPGEPAAQRSLVDTGGHARAGYDVDGDALVLVRPDGHIGWLAVPGTAGQLDDYLRPLIAGERPPAGEA
ncbi:FAD-dependent oxidoreductase [Sorangium sp. So ce1099]|uniref:FAD-dependent oxidoreductase n=1 Tax=Sorangium sp. So ce1099 TaxID=3133331 RepID=UPI003F60B662